MRRAISAAFSSFVIPTVLCVVVGVAGCAIESLPLSEGVGERVAAIGGRECVGICGGRADIGAGFVGRGAITAGGDCGLESQSSAPILLDSAGAGAVSKAPAIKRKKM